MVGVVTLPRILFVPDRFSDYRMWSDIPDRLAGRVEAIHFEQHRQNLGRLARPGSSQIRRAR
jgi:hypothetical protein